MSEQTEIRISDMLRQTATNSSDLMMKIADHLDRLESKIAALEAKLTNAGIEYDEDDGQGV